MNRLTFRDRGTIAGNQGYTLEVKRPEKDPIPENNVAQLLVGVGGPRPLLHVSERRRSRAGGAACRTAGSTCGSARPQQVNWTLEELSRYSGVMLENVPADKIGHVGMETLAAWVRETGGGPDDDRRAVSPTARAATTSRRWSRSCPCRWSCATNTASCRWPSSWRWTAPAAWRSRSAAARRRWTWPTSARPRCSTCSGRWTSSAASPSTRGARDRAAGAGEGQGSRCASKILRIQSQGGGIYVYEALAKAAEMIMKAKAGTKHIILFADATDAEEPGDATRTC